MEAAGLVLGAVPGALYALDNYKRYLRVTKDVIKYEATITTFHHQVFIQKKQLELTLITQAYRLLTTSCPQKLS